MNKLREFCLAIQQMEGYAPGTRSYINKNPGNVRSSPFQLGQKAGFAYFATYEKGFEALLYDVKNKCLGKTQTGLGPNSTILRFANVWAPASDGNWPENYAQFIAKQVGLTPASKLKEIYPGVEPPEPVIPTQRILCILNNFPPERAAVVKHGVQEIARWFDALAVPTEIVYISEYTQPFPIVEITGTSGRENVHKPVKVINPEVLGKHIGERATGYNFVVFCYRLDTPGLTPVEIPQSVNGAYVTQLPVLDVSDAWWVSLFLSHELMHGFIMLANNAGHPTVDDVHSRSWTATTDSMSYTGIVKNLRPYLSDMLSKRLDIPKRYTVAEQQEILTLIQIALNYIKSILGVYLSRKNNFGSMNILGKLPESTARAGELDWPAVLKVLRTALVTGIAAALGSLTVALPMLDPIKDGQWDNMLITLCLIPGIEALRRLLTNYSQEPPETELPL